MARVVVIGGGLGGLAAAARLAKLGHAVVLCECDTRLGGLVHRVGPWDLGPTTIGLPAALRDLFRKSGRPIERMLELRAVETPRRHVFADGSTLDLPVTSRAAQQEAIAGTFGGRAAHAWTQVVDGLTPVWDLARRTGLEAPWGGLRTLGVGGLRTLSPWRTVRSVARRLPDPRLRQVFAATALGCAEDPSRAPGVLAVGAYVERTFGRWTCDGGPSAIVDALQRRLVERRVEVRLETPVARIVGAEGGVVSGVRLGSGQTLPADVVVAAVPLAGLLPGPLSGPLSGSGGSGARRAARAGAVSCARAVRAYGIRLSTPRPDGPFETVLHGPIGAPGATVARLSADGTVATVLPYAWTDQPLDPPDPQALGLAGEPEPLDVPAYGPILRGRGAFGKLAPTVTSVRGLYRVGASARPGPGVPAVLLGAALAATEVGKA